MPFYGVVIHNDGTVTVLDAQAEGQFNGSTRALNQAKRVVARGEHPITDTYTVVIANTKADAETTAKELSEAA